MSDRGLSRERRLRKALSDAGWVSIRASKGIVDLVCLKPDAKPRLVQVKSTAQGPYERFGPKERRELIELALAAGAEAWLIWWPPHRGWRWIPTGEWPQPKEAAA